MPHGAPRVSVLLVGLPGILAEVLKHELRGDADFQVTRLAAEETRVVPNDLDSVVVVGTGAASLRQITTLFDRGVRVLGTIAVTDEPPIGDVYLLSPAGTNVSPSELARVIRTVASAGGPSIAHAAPAHMSTHTE
jgi:hypothetical protein